LTLTQLDKPIGQLFSGVWLTGFGVAGALGCRGRSAELGDHRGQAVAAKAPARG